VLSVLPCRAHFTVEGHLACFRILASVRSAAVNMGLPVLLGHMAALLFISEGTSTLDQPLARSCLQDLSPAGPQNTLPFSILACELPDQPLGPCTGSSALPPPPLPCHAIGL
jgi:hypothetical protein